MKKNINPIPKSLRERKRYVKLNYINKREITKAVFDLYGINGFAEIGLQFLKNNIIKVKREKLDCFLSAINYYNLFNDKKMIVEKISGTIKSLSEKYEK